MSCNKKFIAEVKIFCDGTTRPKTFLKYACIDSNKIYYYDKKTLKQVDFEGRAGEELVQNEE